VQIGKPGKVPAHALSDAVAADGPTVYENVLDEELIDNRDVVLIEPFVEPAAHERLVAIDDAG
jgi:hypothetical protein